MGLLVRLVSLVAIAWMAIVVVSFNTRLAGPDQNSCRAVAMSPAYAKLHAFDKSHTPLANKYSLYLYREQGKDVIPDPERHQFTLDGTPVLFIPGNAGSFKQVRSIASESTSLFHDSVYASKLDFFSADFNEDFTAFHGRTMLDQAQYLNEAIKFILSLYKHNQNPPKSVILLGHSMGGIVARVMLSLPNYLPESVNTILTLSAPHSAAPTTFDGDLLQVFTLTDNFWRLGFYNGSLAYDERSATIARERLVNVSIVSITGGTLDTTLPADYTSLDGIVPASNGISVSTTGIPGVWSAIDHLAVVWCDQLRHVVSKILLEIIDKNSPYQTLPLEKRMNVFKHHLLTNFDSELTLPESVNQSNHLPYLIKFDYKQLAESTNKKSAQPVNSKKIIKRDVSTPNMQVFYIPKEEIEFKFNFVSSLKPVHITDFLIDDPKALNILLCKTASSKSMTDEVHYDYTFDYTSPSTKQYVELECVSIHDSINIVPKSEIGIKSLGESSFSGPNSPFYSLEIPPSILSKYNTVVVSTSSDFSSNSENDDFVVADMELNEACHEVLGTSSLWSLISKGADITLAPHCCSIVNVDVPSVKSGLLAYQLDIRYKRSSKERFSPLLGQHVPGELKWHIGIHENRVLNILINGEAPYVPIPKKGDNNLKLKVISDSHSEQIMDIYLSVDWFTTFSLVVLKYRLSIIGFPLFVCIMCFIIQLMDWMYYKKGEFPSFLDALNKLCSGKLFIILLIVFSIASPLTTSTALGPLISLLDPVPSPDWNLLPDNMSVNWNFLGIDELNLWFYGPLMLCASIILNYIVFNAINLAKDALVGFVKIILKTGHTNIKTKNIMFQVLSLPLNLTTYTLTLIFLKLGFTIKGRIRRSFGVIAITILVLLYFPYQFAYIVAFFTHVVGILRLTVNNDRALEKYNINEKLEHKLNAKASRSQMNFNLSIFMILLWILPIQVPVLIVWLHNLSLKWTTPFSSHHNVLAVLPIILVVLACNRNTNVGIDKIESTSKHEDEEKGEEEEKVEKSKSNWSLYLESPVVKAFFQKWLLFLLVYMAFYCVMFGTRHLFFIHELFDIICVVILLCWVNGALGGTMHTVGLMGYSRGWRNHENVSSRLVDKIN